ncbi:MAG: hypothetical protein LC722_05185 [Actinobacteria bacterium]|nr:hypothetical protein [Actinomycetota bacterium]
MASRRGPALALLAVFGLAVVIGVLFFVLTDPAIQTVDAAELVRRRSDAVAFFTLDYLFVVVYAVAGPIALWRFAGTLDRVPRWLVAGVAALALGGLFDAAENALLMSASSSGGQRGVDLAHRLAIPKYVLGAIGLIVAVRAVAMAARAVRR